MLMPLFTLKLPQNAALFFNFIMQIAAFDVLPTDAFYDDYFSMEAKEAVNDNFDALGFNSMWFLYNMGSLTLSWVCIPLLALPIFLLRCVKCITRLSPTLNKMHTNLDRWMFWQFPITVLNQSCLIVYMCCLINLLLIDFSSDKISTVSAIVMLCVVVVAPIRLTYRLARYGLDDTIAAFYDGLNIKRGKGLAY